MMDDPTLDFYQQNAEKYAAATFDVDVSAIRGRFLRLLKPGARILDAGCGSGRDSLAFLRDGFDVTATEPAASLAAIAARNTGLEILPLRFQDFEFDRVFDGVWACASLLHVLRAEMLDVLRRLEKSLTTGGVLFASLKIADSDFTDKGRHFTAVTPPQWSEWLDSSTSFSVLEQWTSPDFLGREDVTWLNCLALRVS